MSRTSNGSMPESPLVSTRGPLEHRARSLGACKEAIMPKSAGASPKVGRRSTFSHGTSSPPGSTTSEAAGPTSAKGGTPSSPFIPTTTRAPTGRGPSTQRKQKPTEGSVKTAMRMRGRAGHASATAGLSHPSATAGLFRPSATAGLSRIGHSSEPGPSPFSNAASEGSGIIDLRALNLPAMRARGRTSRSRSPMATPSSVGGGSGATPSAASLSARHGNEPPSKILDFLFLGSVQDAKDAGFLSRNHIAYIINVSTEEYWAVDKNIVVYPFKIEDSLNANISVFFQPAFHIIEKVRRMYYDAKKKSLPFAPRILIHCQKGRSRSPSIVLSYLITRNGWSVAEALEYVAKRRRDVEPNLAFMDALRELQESLNTEERSKRYALQILLVKNLSSKTSAEAVKTFFEKHVGCVRDVVMHARSHTSASGTDQAHQSSGGANHQGESQTVAEEDGAFSQQHSEELSNAAGTSTPDASHVAGDCLSSAEGDKEELRATGADGTTECGLSITTAEGDSCARGAACESALCLVFFACFEDVKRAREYAATHPAEMSQLGSAPGKDVKLTVPIKSFNGNATMPMGLTSGSAVTSVAGGVGQPATPPQR